MVCERRSDRSSRTVCRTTGRTSKSSRGEIRNTPRLLSSQSPRAPNPVNPGFVTGRLERPRILKYALGVRNLVEAGTRTVEDVLRQGGFTAFHRRLVLLTGFAWTFVAFEIILIGFVLPAIFAEFGLTPANNPILYFLVASATLMGSFIGSLILGRLADARGRRVVFLASILWYSVFTGLTALAWDPWSVFGFRLLAGLGLGGMLVVDPALLSEFLPPQSRGRFMVLLDFFWPIGFLLAIGFWWAFIVQGVTVAGLASWRLLFVAAAFPAFIAFLARVTIPESPFFHARHGRLDEAARVLSKISGRPIDPTSLSREQAVPRAPISALFQGRLTRRSLVTIIVWVALNFS